MTEELLNELTEKLIAAYRARLEAQKAYYGRENEVDDELEQAVVDQTTIVQVSEGNGYLPFLEIHGSVLALSPDTELYINDVRWTVVRRRVDVDTASRAILTTITVVPYGRDEGQA